MGIKAMLIYNPQSGWGGEGNKGVPHPPRAGGGGEEKNPRPPPPLGSAQRFGYRREAGANRLGGTRHRAGARGLASRSLASDRLGWGRDHQRDREGDAGIANAARYPPRWHGQRPGASHRHPADPQGGVPTPAGWTAEGRSGGYGGRTAFSLDGRDRYRRGGRPSSRSQNEEASRNVGLLDTGLSALGQLRLRSLDGSRLRERDRGGRFGGRAGDASG